VGSSRWIKIIENQVFKFEDSRAFTSIRDFLLIFILVKPLGLLLVSGSWDLDISTAFSTLCSKRGKDNPNCFHFLQLSNKSSLIIPSKTAPIAFTSK